MVVKVVGMIALFIYFFFRDNQREYPVFHLRNEKARAFSAGNLNFITVASQGRVELTNLLIRSQVIIHLIFWDKICFRIQDIACADGTC